MQQYITIMYNAITYDTTQRNSAQSIFKTIYNRGSFAGPGRRRGRNSPPPPQLSMILADIVPPHTHTHRHHTHTPCQPTRAGFVAAHASHARAGFVAMGGSRKRRSSGSLIRVAHPSRSSESLAGVRGAVCLVLKAQGPGPHIRVGRPPPPRPPGAPCSRSPMRGPARGCGRARCPSRISESDIRAGYPSRISESDIRVGYSSAGRRGPPDPSHQGRERAHGRSRRDSATGFM